MPAPGENPALDAETRVPMLVAFSVVFVLLSTVVVLLRLYTRYMVVAFSGPDDITIAIAQVLSIAVSVATILQAKFSLGRHVWMVNEEDNINQLKAFFATMLIYNLSQIVTKCSFLFQYRRIFEKHWTRAVCMWMMGILIAWGIAQEVLVAFACVPVSMFIPSQAAVCIKSEVVWYLTSVVNIVTDFIIFTIPIPAVRSLQLRKKQKILVGSVFSLGFFTCVISIVRLFTLNQAISSADPTWDNVPSAYWSIVELNCGILCASLPPLRPLLRHIIPGLSQRRSTLYQRNYQQKDSRPAPRDSVPIDVEHGSLYALHDVESTESHKVSSVEADDYPRRLSVPGQSSSSYFTTDVWNGQHAAPPEYADRMDGGAGSRSSGSRDITVTTEVGVYNNSRRSVAREGP